MTDLLDIISATRMLESGLLQGNTSNLTPVDIVKAWSKKDDEKTL
jgi:hypothetical protein